MAFNVSFPIDNGDIPISNLGVGEVLFVLGPNGSGKSSLMFHFATINSGNSRRISAHRQTWINTDTINMTPASKLTSERNIQGMWDSSMRITHRLVGR